MQRVGSFELRRNGTERHTLARKRRKYVSSSECFIFGSLSICIQKKQDLASNMTSGCSHLSSIITSNQQKRLALVDTLVLALFMTRWCRLLALFMTPLMQTAGLVYDALMQTAGLVHDTTNADCWPCLWRTNADCWPHLWRTDAHCWPCLWCRLLALFLTPLMQTTRHKTAAPDYGCVVATFTRWFSIKNKIK